MKLRPTAILGLAAIVIVGIGAVSHAELGLFGDYWGNVARAAHQNDAAQVQVLLANNSNPNQTDEESRTGLHYAAMNGNLQIIAILIKASANINVKDKLGNTPLHLAADRNQAEVGQLLLDA